MKTILKTFALFSLVLFLSACSTDKKVQLFNGENLDNWNIFVSTDDVQPEELFYVKDGMISTLGVPHGYIRTKETYSNFKLHVEWRWTAEPTNSGVLLHVTGKDMIWPLSIECQLMNGKAGDLVLIRDHLNLQFQSPLTGPVWPGEERFPDMTQAWDPALRRTALQVADLLNAVGG